jgi:hypothetical protein
MAWRSPGRLGFSFAILAIGLSGCDLGSKSTNETTPPALTWSVLNQTTNDRQDLPADAIVDAGPDAHYLVTFKANDPGGVQHIAMKGGAEWHCRGDGVAQNKDALYTPEASTLHADSNGQVEHFAFLLYTISPDGWDCQSGFDYDGGEATVHGSASNYSNQQATGTLTIRRPH